jgi:hypothetical protein
MKNNKINNINSFFHLVCTFSKMVYPILPKIKIKAPIIKKSEKDQLISVEK